MAAYAIGIALFALAILVSVALHECGHMWVAQATGMKVRRYFVGFGPTLWSTKRKSNRPNKQGANDIVEYGVKAVPLGGFCDIAGMTSVEELTPEESDRAMYKQKVWKRVAVLFAGPAMNFLIGIVVFYGVVLFWGLPDNNAPTHPEITQTSCVAPQKSADPRDVVACTGEGPAALAGLRAGDQVLTAGGTSVSTSTDLVTAIRGLRGPQVFEIVRDGKPQSLIVNVTETQRWDEKAGKLVPVGAVGASLSTYVPQKHYNPVTAIPATGNLIGTVAVETVKAIGKIPMKVGALWDSITGSERAMDTPMSIVGASRMGGETVEHDMWIMFWILLAQLNFALGAINLLPLLPFDGGHIAVATYEKVRNMIRSARGLAVGAPVNYMKLMPATYLVLVVVVGYMLLTITADIVNPIRLFQ
ncbi:Probable protease/peptidase [Mycobacteroides abscessus subsp. abscessus]|uniref:M50 family metallopeptidase n=1 Tax=Mycobacteroides abscessus TaxID=36809 RepID=UPI0002586982|nr:M50 family metallopeptidase [Mycobacteroides abscessus]EIC67785.1 protease/peptidase [Mycobacteroides abscessus M93]SHW85839.1 Probable protease/peptidase [Mycobacteroides abscessus subsp. abscessus]SIB99007.1 Probable protease/peptidase [Mycobacteroides abscessus subsp. abscessus]SID43649.1 Probable protease/peptidase [Mycobacteroides abscessus subsp. abscessus]SKD85039.1 Probable protease/peptidase [Mycobacteroides abscessus subsp. abscessus]